MRTAATSFVLLWLLAEPASAHRSVPERAVMLQVDEHGVSALCQVRVSGTQAALYVAMYDLDHDGSLSAGENKALAALLLAKLPSEVAVRLDGALLAWTGSEAHAEVLADAVMAMGLFELRAPLRPPGRHSLRVESLRGGPVVQVQTLDDWRLVSAGQTLAPDRRGLAEPVQLQPGTAVEVEATRGARAR